MLLVFLQLIDCTTVATLQSVDLAACCVELMAISGPACPARAYSPLSAEAANTLSPY